MLLSLFPRPVFPFLPALLDHIPLDRSLCFVEFSLPLSWFLRKICVNHSTLTLSPPFFPSPSLKTSSSLFPLTFDVTSCNWQDDEAFFPSEIFLPCSCFSSEGRPLDVRPLSLGARIHYHFSGLIKSFPCVFSFWRSCALLLAFCFPLSRLQCFPFLMEIKLGFPL